LGSWLLDVAKSSKSQYTKSEFTLAPQLPVEQVFIKTQLIW